MNSLTPAARTIRNILNQLKVNCSLCGQSNLERGEFDQHITTHRPDRNQQGSNRSTANHPPSTGRQSNDLSSSLFIIFVVFIFFVIMMFRSSKDSSPSKNDKTGNALDNSAIATPISCTSIQQCPSRNNPFESSYLLSSENQIYLNYFYNDSASRLASWKLIY
ncbi:unnamed protein product, partial [Adineta ricciae]